MEIDFDKFDTSKEFTIADLASAFGIAEKEVARILEREFYAEFEVGVTDLGKSKLPGLRFPKWNSGQYGHWSAEHWFTSHGWTSARIAERYGLKPHMADSDWKVALGRAARDETEWGVVLHGKQRFFERVLNRGFEFTTLGEIDWITLRKDEDKWSIQDWVSQLRETGKPWLLFLNRESLGKEIVVLDAEQFRKLLK